MERFTEEQREAALLAIRSRGQHLPAGEERIKSVLLGPRELAIELQCELTEALDKIEKLQNKLLEAQQ